MPTRLEDYTVGWICAIPLEYVAACEMLDEEYTRDQIPKLDTRRDTNSYTFGRIYEHNVVVACLPKGRYGITSAVIVAERMRSNFPALRFGLMVGLGGGAPSQNHDIRLGDVVVSSPTSKGPGVIQYDFGKAFEDHKFEETGHLAPPPEVLLNAVSSLEMQHARRGHRIEETVFGMLSKNKRLRAQYDRPDADSDRLYEKLADGEEQLARRKDRHVDEDDPVIHYGLIASANKVLKDRETRDALIKKYDVLCFEMEAAGLMDNFPCLVIRGICDYCDSYKNDDWHGYAAAAAAAYAKELLEIILPGDIQGMQKIEETSEQQSRRFDIQFSLTDVPLTKRFVARTRELQGMEEALLAPAAEDSQRRRLFVLSGLGGIGKTQLAVEFMRRHQSTFSAIFWLDGSSVDSVKKSIAHCATRISPDQISEASIAFARRGEGDIDVAVRGVLEWLAQPLNNRWLLVFDNVDREYTLSDTDPLSYDIKKYLPGSDHGCILVTTRLAQLGRLGSSVEVKKVDIDTARNILNSWYKGEHDEPECNKLLESLDGLPLAIAQAGAYLQENGVSIAEYLQLYNDRQPEMARLLDHPEVPLEDYSNRSVWTTWSISYDTILKRDKHVAHLLILWSFLDRRDLWFELFSETSVSGDALTRDALSMWIGNIADKKAHFLSAMSLLRRHSLIEGSNYADANTDISGYSMHTVVHRWAYFYHGLKHQSDIGVLALIAVGYALPGEEQRNSAQLQRRLLPHVRECSHKVLDLPKLDKLDRDADEDAYLKGPCWRDFLRALLYFGIIYHDQGQLTEAEQIWKRALVGGEAKIGGKNGYTLQVIGNLGELYRNEGKQVEAEQMLLRALRGLEETIGGKHKTTLETVNNLGALYLDQGRPAEAEQMLLRSLAGFKEILGDKDWRTLSSIEGLAQIYRSRGRLAEAEKMSLQALQGMEEMLGDNHTLTLITVRNLGAIYQDQDRLAEAEQLLLRALAGQQEVLGDGNPETIKTMNNLGVLYKAQGKLAEAEQMYDQALARWEASFGSERAGKSMVSLLIMGNLGSSLFKSKPDKARDMFMKAYSGYKSLLGESSEKCLSLKKRLEELRLSTLSESGSVDVPEKKMTAS